MTRRNPFEEIEQLFERMSQQVDTGDWRALGGQPVPIDVVDLGETLEVRVDLPGYEQEGIDLTLSEGSLRLDAKRELETEDDSPDVRFVQRERHRESVSRTVRLPERIVEEEASARYDDGVLTVELPKADPDEGGRRIDIQ